MPSSVFYIYSEHARLALVNLTALYYADYTLDSCTTQWLAFILSPTHQIEHATRRRTASCNGYRASGRKQIERAETFIRRISPKPSTVWTLAINVWLANCHARSGTRTAATSVAPSAHSEHVYRAAPESATAHEMILLANCTPDALPNAHRRWR